MGGLAQKSTDGQCRPRFVLPAFPENALASFLVFHIFLGHRQHQFDAVELVDLTGTGIVVHGGNVGLRIVLFQDLDHTLTNHMVGQARKGLNADDVGHAGRNQLDHLPRQEPPFAILVAHRQIGLGHLGDFFNGYRRIKALALAQSINGRAAQSPHHLDARFGRKLRAPARPQVFMAVFTAQQAIVEEVQHIRHHGLGSLSLQDFNQMVIGQGHILDQDLADHAHPGLAEGLVNGQAVKSLNNAPANPAIGIGAVLINQGLNADLFPLPVQLLGIFSNSEKVFEIGRVALRIIGISFVPATFSLMMPIFFQAIGKAAPSVLLTLSRQIFCLIPIFYAMSFIGLNYTWIAFPAAEIITGSIGIALYLKQIHAWGCGKKC